MNKGGSGGDGWLAKKVAALDIHDDLSDVLECPICFEICLPPSYCCAKGHLICEKCRPGITCCPICRDATLTVSKNLPMFVQKCDFKCGNYNFGCDRRLNGYDVRSHEADCYYSRVKCPTPLCDMTVAISSLSSHVQKEHADACFSMTAMSVIKENMQNLREDLWHSVYYFVCKENMVAFHIECDKEEVKMWGQQLVDSDDMMLSVILELGSKQMNWRCKLTRRNENPGEHIYTCRITALESYCVDGYVSMFVELMAIKSLPSGCTHYQRKCTIVCPDRKCNARFSCRLCHDSAVSSHILNRFAVREIVCCLCGWNQVPKKECGNCKTVFAKYYCEVCHLYDDKSSELDIFHCKKCGICRRKQTRETEYFHCDSCCICIPKSQRHSHRCKLDASKGHCFICREKMHDSKVAIVLLSCGHYVHSTCREQMHPVPNICRVCSSARSSSDDYDD